MLTTLLVIVLLGVVVYGLWVVVFMGMFFANSARKPKIPGQLPVVKDQFGRPLK